MGHTPEEHVMDGQRTALLLRDVSSALVFLHRAEDDVHLFQTATLRLWDKPGGFGPGHRQDRLQNQREEYEKTYREKTAMPPMLIVANMRKSL